MYVWCALYGVLQVLKDKERLRKRTQLRRSVYRILGEPREDEEPAEGDDQSKSERDLHLKDYNEDIFDDDDFYHQVRLFRSARMLIGSK